MNKKTLIATALTSAMLAGGASAFSDAEGFDTSLGFTGTIVDNEKGWEWRTPEATKTALQNLDAIQSEGVMENNIWSKEFALGVNIIEGRTNSVYADAYVAPHVTVSILDKDGAPVELLPRAADYEFSLEATGTAAQSDFNGELALVVGVGEATALRTQLEETIEAGWTSRFTVNAHNQSAAAVLTSSPAFITHFTGATNVHGNIPDGYGPSGHAAPYTAHLDTDGVMTFLGAYTAELKNLKLSFPIHQLPDSWTAQLPVTVTVL